MAVLSPVMGPVLHPVISGIGSLGAGGDVSLEFSVRSALFPNGEQGLWLNPGDFTRYVGEKGPELILDPEFNSAGNWTTTPSWVVSGGVATHNGSGADYIYTATEAPLVGKWYELVVTATAVIGVISVYCGQTPAAFNITSPGTYKIAAQCPGTGMKFALRCSNASGGNTVVTAFSAKELTGLNTATLFQDWPGALAVTAVGQPNGLELDKRLGLERGAEDITNGGFESDAGWSLPTGWSISSGNLLASAVASGSSSSRVSEVLANAWYAVEVDVTSVSSGGLKVSVGGTDSPTILTAGKYTYTLLTTSTGVRVQAQGAGATFVVASVSAKEIPGNHVIQGTAAARPVLSARKNLLTYSEDFSNAVWAKGANAAITANTQVAPDGATTADTYTSSGSADALYCTPTGMSASAPYTFSIRLKQGTGRWIKITVGSNGYQCWVDTQTATSGTANTFGTGGSLIEATVTALTDGWMLVRLSGTIPGTAGYIQLNSVAGNAMNTQASGTYYVWGAQFEYGPTATRYQRVNTATDYDTNGFLYYTKLDGVDDGFGTTFPAGTLGSNMDCFMLVRRDATTQAALMYGQSASEVAALVVSGDGAAAYGNAGTPTYAVNGAAVTATRGALHTALPVGNWCVLEIRNLDLSTWTALRFGDLVGNRLNGALAEVILAPAQNAEKRTKVREYLAAKGGIAL